MSLGGLVVGDESGCLRHTTDSAGGGAARAHKGVLQHLGPAAFLRAQKMHAAAELLRSTDRTVLDIAGQFGYDNASKFARAFRSVIGVSPNAYRSGATADSCAPV